MSNTTYTLQSVVNYSRSFAEVGIILGRSGFEQEPSLTFGSDTMSKILSQNLNWKFNRAYVPPFLTVALQQDYVTNVTNLSWLEQGWVIDINNSTNAGNRAPKPLLTGTTIRDQPQTAWQSGFPFHISWVPNTLAQMGVWQANTAYGSGYGQAQMPSTPIQQFIDANGNILFIDSTSLNLSINSPGFDGQNPINVTPPYGISGSVQPVLPTKSAAGTTVADGTVTWTVANPDAVAMRLGPLPAFSGVPWLVCPVYQMKPPKFTSLNQLITPIPDEYAYLFRQGFLRLCKMHAGAKDSRDEYAKWEEDLVVAVRGGDREREEFSLYPTTGIMGGGNLGLPIGAAWPYFGGDAGY